MKSYLLGIDVGTTGTKALLISSDGGEMAHAYQGYALNSPFPGYSEQNAEDWWGAVVATVRKVVQTSGVQPKSIAGISLSLQGGTMVPVDENFNPLRPAFVWNDRRCDVQREAFRSRFGSDYMYQKTGWELSSGMNAMEIAWMRDNQPELFRSTAYFLSVPDYISAKLTGRPVVDISNVGINQLADIRTGEYDRRILDFCEIRSGQLAEIARSGEVIGTVLPAAAQMMGLCESTVVVAGAHDQYAGTLGAGVLEEGDVLIGTGTTWVVTAFSDRPNFDRGFAQSVSPVPGKWGNLVSIYTGGVCLEWLRKKLLGNAEASVSYDELNQTAAQSVPGSEGLLFYPYFRGGGFPVNDSAIKATLIGLDLSHSRCDFVRAVMEGVACQTIWAMESFGEAFGLRKLKLAGGAAKSALWMQIVAGIAGIPLRIPVMPDMTCIGAAILAGVGSGVFRDAVEGSERLAIPERMVEPDVHQIDTYRALFADFRRRAPLVQSIYGEGLSRQP